MGFIEIENLSRTRFLLAATAVVCILGNIVCANVNSPANPTEVLTLTASSTSIPADGFSTTTITAQISPQSNENFRDIIFTTTRGSFPAAGPDQATRIVVTADTAGRAAVSLQSTPQTGTAVVTVEIRDGDAVKVARTIDITMEPISASDVIQIQAASPTAPADGATVTEILARIDPVTPVTQRSVLFTTTAGSFGPVSPQTATRAVGSSNVAVAGLTSPLEPATALVTGSLNGLQSRTTVQFQHAMPDGASMTVFGSLQLTATFATKVSLEVELFRQTGKVTSGTIVRFRCFDASTGNMFGFFSGVTPSDENGRVTAQFTPGNTIERGEATIRARVEGTEVLARVRIEIIDPP